MRNLVVLLPVFKTSLRGTAHLYHHVFGKLVEGLGRRGCHAIRNYVHFLSRTKLRNALGDATVKNPYLFPDGVGLRPTEFLAFFTLTPLVSVLLRELNCFSSGVKLSQKLLDQQLLDRRIGYAQRRILERHRSASAVHKTEILGMILEILLLWACLAVGVSSIRMVHARPERIGRISVHHGVVRSGGVIDWRCNAVGIAVRHLHLVNPRDIGPYGARSQETHIHELLHESRHPLHGGKHASSPVGFLLVLDALGIPAENVYVAPFLHNHILEALQIGRHQPCLFRRTGTKENRRILAHLALEFIGPDNFHIKPRPFLQGSSEFAPSLLYCVLDTDRFLLRKNNPVRTVNDGSTCRTHRKKDY